ncbi:MAG: hydroxyacylglutathione hydrolase [Burkholderiaceae bacterium]
MPAFDDNYLWLIKDIAGNAAVVDPGDAEPVQAALEHHGLRLAAILTTHHHGDHTGGVSELVDRWACPVFGPASDLDRIPSITEPLSGGDARQLTAPALSFRVIEVPGHTRTHIAYYLPRLGDRDPRPVLFCGDTLFAAGCGRMFEGNPQQMLASLKKLAALPEDTLVFCAHEYTVSNLHFARAAEPNGPIVAKRMAEAQQMRADGLATVPSSIGIELASNPFLRTAQPGVLAALTEHLGSAPADEGAAFAGLRGWKDVFRAT